MTESIHLFYDSNCNAMQETMCHHFGLAEVMLGERAPAQY